MYKLFPFPRQCKPIILLFKFSIGEPDEPGFVLYLCLNIYFLSSYIPSNIPNDADNFPSGYCIIYIVSFENSSFLSFLFIMLSMIISSNSK